MKNPDVYSGSIDLSSGFSCNGVSVAGSKESIDAVREWHHSHCIVPQLKDRIKDAEQQNAHLTASFAEAETKLTWYRNNRNALLDLVVKKDDEIVRQQAALAAQLVTICAETVEACVNAVCVCCAAGYPPDERGEHWTDFNGCTFAYAPRRCKATSIRSLQYTEK